MALTLWHNPRCSKSRQTLQLLRDKGLEPDIRLYLTDPPSLQELQTLLDQLNLTAHDLVRKSEAVFKEQGLKHADDVTLTSAMAEHPILIERPILIAANKAAIGRPPEAVLAIL